MTHPLKVGDTAWFATHGIREVTRPCPVCFGKLAVTVILGNDEQIQTPCDYCGKGLNGPRGIEVEYEWLAEPRLVTVEGVRMESKGDGFKCEYTFHNHYIAHEEDLFATKEEAEARCAVRRAEHEEDERQRREHRKEYSHKSFSWHVGYHRKCIKEAERQLVWHKARAVACASLARTPVATE